MEGMGVKFTTGMGQIETFYRCRTCRELMVTRPKLTIKFAHNSIWNFQHLHLLCSLIFLAHYAWISRSP